MDSTHRFSDRVDNYARYRPGYPSGVLHILQQETALTGASRIANVVLRELERIFEQYRETGHVTLEYEVELYFGHVTQPHGS